jgi:hypothetical protein
MRNEGEGGAMLWRGGSDAREGMRRIRLKTFINPKNR